MPIFLRSPYPAPREGTGAIFGKGARSARPQAGEAFQRMKKFLAAACLAALVVGCERSDMGGVGSEATKEPGEGRGDRSYRSSGAPESGASQTGSGTGRSTNGPGGADIESR